MNILQKSMMFSKFLENQHIDWFPERRGILESEMSPNYVDQLEHFHLNPRIDSVPNYADPKRWFDDETLQIFGTAECYACKAGTWIVQETLNNWVVKDSLVQIGTFLCKGIFDVIPAQIVTGKVCEGVLHQQFGEAILPVILDKMLSEQIFCTFYLQVCDQDKWQISQTEQFVYDTIASKPEELKDNDFVNKLYEEMKNNQSEYKELINLVLFSDLHVDYKYTEGMSNNCGGSLCCRSDSGPPSKPSEAAAKWGDFACDLPPPTMRVMLDYMKNELNPDAIFWTGDTIPHNLKTLNKEENIEIMKEVTKEVGDRLDGISIYPSIGNHDTYPQDMMSMDKPKGNDVINHFSPDWLRFQIPEDKKQNFLNWGYYSSPLQDSNGKRLGNNENAKVISLNSNICYIANFDNFVTFHDPGNMLEWLENELSELEKVKGAAIIIAHVPNIDECLRTYGRRFHTIVDRYQNVIRWQLFAHKHYEQYQVVTDVLDKKPIGMSLIIGSMTTYKGKPPSFNTVQLDPDTLLPVNWSTYAFDLAHMIKNPEDTPKIDKIWDYLTEYDLPDMSPNTFKELSRQIYFNETAAKQYRNNRFVRGPGDDINAPCDYECRVMYHCQTVAGDWDEWESCRQRYNYVADIGLETLMSALQSFNHAWFKPIKN